MVVSIAERFPGVILPALATKLAIVTLPVTFSAPITIKFPPIYTLLEVTIVDADNDPVIVADPNAALDAVTVDNDAEEI